MENRNLSNPEIRDYKKINKIDFIIHPGFLLTKEAREDFENNSEITDEYKKLFSSYIEEAKKTTEDQLCFVFIPETRTNLKEFGKTKDYYYELLRELKSILGERGVFITDNDKDSTFIGNNLSGAKEQLNKLLAIVKARGYIFDEQALTRAYGEQVGMCVEDAAKKLNKLMGLKKSTLVEVRLTDVGLSVSESKESVKEIVDSNSSNLIDYNLE